MIDDRRRAPGQELLRPVEGIRTKIGIADRVHHQIVPGQLGRGVGIVRVERMNGESPIVDPEPRRDVAAERGHEQQDGHPLAHSAVGLGHQGVSRETARPMMLRVIEPELGEHPGHALMRFVQVGIDGERRLVVHSRAVRVIVLAQHIGEVHPRDLVAGVMRDRLGVGGARRGAESSRERERPQLVEREKIRRLLPEHLEIRPLRAFVVRLGDQCAGALQGFGDLHGCKAAPMDHRAQST